MYILGISALYHDAAACLIKDGDIIAAAQEERFTRKKHDSSIPVNAISYCLSEAGIKANELKAVAFYDQPLLTLDRFIKNSICINESNDLIDRTWLSLSGVKLWVHRYITDYLGGLGEEGKLLTVRHHISHAASAFYPSPFDKAVVITVDGVGEWDTTTIGIGNGRELKIAQTIKYPHSLGLFYSAFSYFCGFKVNSGEYKFMGLAPYGKPVYYDLIKNEMINIKPDGSFRLNLKYFDYQNGRTMIRDDEFSKIFGGPRREAESKITKREMDIAASVQKLTEEILYLIVKHAKERFGEGIDNLCLSGGVALNCVANGKLQKSGIFKNIWIQPAAGDAGGAIGAALYTYYSYYDINRIVNSNDSQSGSLLGPEYSNEIIMEKLNKIGAVYHYNSNEDERNKLVSRILSEGNIVGMFQGRMEFGPRALGNRSIIADCRFPEMQSKLNLKIKYRESFRPFAPIVLAEYKDEYFDLPSDSPYMLKVGLVQEKHRLPFALESELNDSDDNMLTVVNKPRSDVPAITHVDYSARIQTVDADRNKRLHDIMEEYYNLTKCACLVNTSFNVRGEPIVCSPEDAYRCFMRTEMDVLVLEDVILYKEEQPQFDDSEDWRNVYELD